jgi:hypothetical protein
MRERESWVNTFFLPNGRCCACTHWLSRSGVAGEVAAAPKRAWPSQQLGRIVLRIILVCNRE